MPVTAFMDFLDVRELKGPCRRKKSQYLYFSFRGIGTNKTYGPLYLSYPTLFLSYLVGPVFSSEWDHRADVQKEMSELEQHCTDADVTVEKFESGVVQMRGMSKEQFEKLPPELRKQFISQNYSRQARMQTDFPYQKFTLEDALISLSDTVVEWNSRFASVVKEPKKHGTKGRGSRKAIVEFLNGIDENGDETLFSDAVQELRRQKRSIDDLLASLDDQNAVVVDYARKRLMVFLGGTAGIQAFYEPYVYHKLTHDDLATMSVCIIDTEKKFFRYRHGANCHIALTYRDHAGNVFGEIHTTQDPGAERIEVTEGETTIGHKIIVHQTKRAMIEAAAASVNAQNPFFIVAHNAPYDLRLLKYDAKESAGDKVFSAGVDETESRKKFAMAIFQKIDLTGREVLDTFYLSRSINPDNPNHKLVVAMAKLAGKPVSTFKKAITYKDLDELAALSDAGDAEGRKAALKMAHYVASDVTVVADRLFSLSSNLLYDLAVLAHTANVRVADLAFSFRAMENIRDVHEFKHLGLMFEECAFSKYNRQHQIAEEQKFRQSTLPSFKQRWLEAAGIEVKIRPGLHGGVVEAYVPFEAFLRPLLTRRSELKSLFLYLDEHRADSRRYFQLVQSVRAYTDAVFFDYAQIVKVEERYYGLCAKRVAAERAGTKETPEPPVSKRGSRIKAAAQQQDSTSLDLFPVEHQLPKNDPYISLFHHLFGGDEKGSAHRRRQLLRAYRKHGSLTRDMVHQFMPRHRPSKYYVGDTRETLEQLVKLNARFKARHGFWPQEMLDAIKEECTGLAQVINDVKRTEQGGVVQAYGSYLYLDSSEGALEKMARGPTERVRYDLERRKIMQPVSWLVPLKRVDILNRGRGERIYREEGYFKGIIIKSDPKKENCLYEMDVNKEVAALLLAGKNDDAVDAVINAFSALVAGQVPKEQLLFYDSQVDLHFGRNAVGPYAYCRTLDEEPDPALFSSLPLEEAVLSRVYHFDSVKDCFFFADSEAKKGRMYVARESDPTRFHFSDEQGTYGYRLQLVKRGKRSDDHDYKLLRFYYDEPLAFFTPDIDYFVATLFGVTVHQENALSPVSLDLDEGKITRTLEYGGLTREQRERIARAFEACLHVKDAA